MADPPPIPMPNMADAATSNDPYWQRVRDQMDPYKANNGMVGAALSRTTPFMSQQQPYDQRLADARDQQVGALGYARNQALGLAPSAAGIGQQMQLGAGSNQMSAQAQGGNMLAMRNGLAGGFGAMGQQVGEAGKARGQEQQTGLQMYGQGAGQLGQSDLAQRQLSLDNQYRQQQLSLGQARQNYNLGSGYEGLWSEQNKQQALADAADQKRYMQEQSLRAQQSDATTSQAVSAGVTVAEMAAMAI